jgi:hypothetical protein
MTDTTFSTVADQAAQGTTLQPATTVDNNSQVDNGVGAVLQAQITGMEKRITDKDTHISTVESENMKLRQDMSDIQSKLDNSAQIEEALERIQTSQHDSNQDTALDEDALINRLKASLATDDQQKTAQQNFDEVAGEFTRRFGADAADEKVRQLAVDNSLSFDDIVDLARKSPNAVYKMAGLSVNNNIAGTASRSTHVGFNNEDEGSSSKDRAMAEFAKLRRENPKEYWKPNVQKEFRKLFN